jgi:predicted MFS family arabinose efflux permease
MLAGYLAPQEGTASLATPPAKDDHSDPHSNSSKLGGSAGERISVIAALQHYPDYRTLWISTVLTQVAHWTFQVAMGWLMLVLTDSASWVGLLGFFAGLPFLIVSIPAGVLIDRFDRRMILLVCQCLSLIAGLSIALLATADLVQPWHLLAATFLSGAALAANNATRQTMVPSLVSRAHLQNAIALMSAGQNTTRILGPGIAGPAIAIIGIAGTFYLQAGVLVLALINTMMLPTLVTSGGQAINLRRNLVDGIRFMTQSRLLMSLMFLATIPTLIAFPYLNFLPVFARDVLEIGPDGLGLLFAAGGAGAVTGSLIVAGLNRVQRRGLFILIWIGIYTGVLIALAYSTWLPLSLAMLFMGGVCGSSFMSMNNTLLHMNVTDEMRGRVMGVYLITFGLMPLGALPMGYLADQIGISHAVALAAVVMLLATVIVAVRFPEIRRAT